MLYKVTPEEQHRAKNPHHIFNINIILTHLVFSKLALGIGGGNPLHFLIVPFVSILVLSYVYFHGKELAKTGSWFIAAHWQLTWRRGRILIISYIVAIVILLLSQLFGSVLGGGLMMNNLSLDGSSTPIHEKITMFFAAVVVFLAVLVTFFQTGISVYDAGRGIIDANIAKYLPRDENSNIELGIGKEEIHHTNIKTAEIKAKVTKDE